MAATERITMTMRELDRFKVIQDVADGRLKPWRAAERLRLTTRQIRRLVARLREQGPAGLVSHRHSMPSNNRLDSAKADQALSIIRDRYTDFDQRQTADYRANPPRQATTHNHTQP